jgi:hypothetical protein
MSKTKTSDYRYSKESYLNYSESLSFKSLIRSIQRTGKLSAGSFITLRTISVKDGRLMSVTDGNYEVDSVNVTEDNAISMNVVEVDSNRNFTGEAIVIDFVNLQGNAISEKEGSFTSVLWLSSSDNKRLLPPVDRLRIYEIAYDLYKKDKNNFMFGMCLYMKEAAKSVIDEVDQIKCSPYHYSHIYPEFIECRPCSASLSDYWWVTTNIQLRMEAFEQMISSVKEKIKEEGQSDVSI